jgi:hypothetical protein
MKNFAIIFKELDRFRAEKRKTVIQEDEIQLTEEVKKLCEIISQTTEQPVQFYTST